MPTLILVVILFIFAWIFLVLPQRRRQRAHQAMQDSVTVGDDIITAGGIHGTVREAEGEDVELEIAPGVVVTLDRRAIAAVADELEPEEDEADGEEAEEDGEVEEDEPVEDDSLDDADDPGKAEERLKG